MSLNVIILTSGLTGSSVVAGLFAQSGYWVGDETIHKPDYNTWENAELVKLNQQILSETNFTENWTMCFRPNFIDVVTTSALRLDPQPYLSFIEKCAQHSPWIWKDPRLWLTIRYWQTLLDLTQVRFILLTRDPLQSWISMTLRRQIQTFDYARKYEIGINNSLRYFLDKNAFCYIEVEYEQLLLHPTTTLWRINNLIDLSLTVSDLRKTFNGLLYQYHHGMFDFFKAIIIYVKNYWIRYR
ncbi:hypothetical protein [Thiospirillum jenense]|uniref:Sulfotransferase family protein n=1 Tax=Thiospirillum jenense TaxID=1653858 RepID=A0A839H859_9GAMM|nr:hypothetical protein [Thiospirillum jenense]MBB1125371.1 hypothetical protein [Thiospirillum jenense]